MRPDLDLRFTVHDDDVPADAAIVGDGLVAANALAAALHDVRPLAVFARDDAGRVVAGAVGRTWGRCCELQQLWVGPELRGRGIGSHLLQVFEQQAIARHCGLLYLDTFSFQARPLYEARGYRVVLEIAGFDVGISKYTMTRELPDG